VSSSDSNSGVQAGSLTAWRLAVRPPTLVAGGAPVLLGASLAARAGMFDFFLSSMAMVVAISVQIGTNLINDWADFRKGADTSARIGPIRVTQAGLLPEDTVRNAGIVAMCVALLAGLLIVLQAGWIYLIVGALSVVSGVAYTTGPFPLAYIGLGDIWAFLFFGLVATMATYSIQTDEVTLASFALGTAMGLFAAALLGVNNLRDLATDREAGKKTLAVRLGRTPMKYLILLEILVASMMAVAVSIAGGIGWGGAIGVLAIFVGRDALRTVWKYEGDDPRTLLPALQRVSQTQLVFAILVSLGMGFG